MGGDGTSRQCIVTGRRRPDGSPLSRRLTAAAGLNTPVLDSRNVWPPPRSLRSIQVERV